MNLSEREKLILAYMEGDLAEAERIELEALLKEDPLLREELAAFEGTRVQADENIVFGKKELLLKPVPARRIAFRPYIIPSAVAASLILLLGWYFLFNDPVPANDKPSVVKEERSKPLDKPADVVKVPEEKQVAVVAEEEKEKEKEKKREKEVVSVVDPSQGGKSIYVNRTAPVVREEEKETLRSEITSERLVTIALPAKHAPAFAIEGPEPELIPQTLEAFKAPVMPDHKGFSFAETKENIGRKLARIATYLKKPDIDIERNEEERRSYTINIYQAAWIK